MAARSIKPTRAPAEAAPAIHTPPSEKSGPVDETLSSTGRDENSGEGSDAQRPADTHAEGEQAKPEAEQITAAPLADAAGGSHAAGDGHEQSAPETGEASEDGSAAAASDADTHPAAGLIEQARAARDATEEPQVPGAPIRLIYPVRSPLRHDRRRYSPDDPEANTIELTEAEAETLIAIGVLGECP